AAALALALGAAVLARRPASLKRTFGFRRVEVLAALFNGATVFLVAGFIVVEAYHRVTEPEPVQSAPMLAVAVLGLAGNAVALWVLGHGHSLNERGAYLHVLGDLLSSVGVVVAGLLIFWFNWTIVDPILSIGIALLLLNSAWRLMREAVDVLLLTVPATLDLAKAHDALMTVPGVRSAHDLHAWTVTSGFVSLSGHLTVLPTADQHAVLVQALDLLRREFGLEHVTLQIEWDETQAAIHPGCEPCRDSAPVSLAPASALTPPPTRAA
ncbi:MAG: cation diffusion facilitator family transporter, partial [Dehalococcoidia bacterium]|nr:cation diffusion facilitator family transporter [Dehalococcoidia bacterium]